MFGSRNPNNLVNKIQARSLKLIINDNANAFEYLLQAVNEIKRDQRNLQVLLIKVLR